MAPLNIFNSLFTVQRLYRYIIKRFLGKYLLKSSSGLRLDQLDVQLYEGSIKLFDLELDPSSINEHINGTFPVRFASIQISRVRVSIPWKHMFQEKSRIYVDGLRCEIDSSFGGKYQEDAEGQASPRDGGLEFSSGDIIDTISRLFQKILVNVEVVIDDCVVKAFKEPASLRTQCDSKSFELVKLTICNIIVLSEACHLDTEQFSWKKTALVTGVEVCSLNMGGYEGIGGDTLLFSPVTITLISSDVRPDDSNVHRSFQVELSCNSGSFSIQSKSNLGSLYKFLKKFIGSESLSSKSGENDMTMFHSFVEDSNADLVGGTSSMTPYWFTKDDFDEFLKDEASITRRNDDSCFDNDMMIRLGKGCSGCDDVEADKTPSNRSLVSSLSLRLDKFLITFSDEALIGKDKKYCFCLEGLRVSNSSLSNTEVFLDRGFLEERLSMKEKAENIDSSCPSPSASSCRSFSSIFEDVDSPSEMSCCTSSIMESVLDDNEEASSSEIVVNEIHDDLDDSLESKFFTGRLVLEQVLEHGLSSQGNGEFHSFLITDIKDVRCDITQSSSRSSNSSTRCHFGLSVNSRVNVVVEPESMNTIAMLFTIDATRPKDAHEAINVSKVCGTHNDLLFSYSIDLLAGMGIEVLLRGEENIDKFPLLFPHDKSSIGVVDVPKFFYHSDKRDLCISSARVTSHYSVNENGQDDRFVMDISDILMNIVIRESLLSSSSPCQSDKKSERSKKKQKVKIESDKTQGLDKESLLEMQVRCSLAYTCSSGTSLYYFQYAIATFMDRLSAGSFKSLRRLFTFHPYILQRRVHDMISAASSGSDDDTIKFSVTLFCDVLELSQVGRFHGVSLRIVSIPSDTVPFSSSTQLVVLVEKIDLISDDKKGDEEESLVGVIKGLERSELEKEGIALTGQPFMDVFSLHKFSACHLEQRKSEGVYISIYQRPRIVVNNESLDSFSFPSLQPTTTIFYVIEFRRVLLWLDLNTLVLDKRYPGWVEYFSQDIAMTIPQPTRFSPRPFSVFSLRFLDLQVSISHSSPKSTEFIPICLRNAEFSFGATVPVFGAPSLASTGCSFKVSLIEVFLPGEGVRRNPSVFLREGSGRTGSYSNNEEEGIVQVAVLESTNGFIKWTDVDRRCSISAKCDNVVLSACADSLHRLCHHFQSVKSILAQIHIDMKQKSECSRILCQNLDKVFNLNISEEYMSDFKAYSTSFSVSEHDEYSTLTAETAADIKWYVNPTSVRVVNDKFSNSGSTGLGSPDGHRLPSPGLECEKFVAYSSEGFPIEMSAFQSLLFEVKSTSIRFFSGEDWPLVGAGVAALSRSARELKDCVNTQLLGTRLTLSLGKKIQPEEAASSSSYTDLLGYTGTLTSREFHVKDFIASSVYQYVVSCLVESPDSVDNILRSAYDRHRDGQLSILFSRLANVGTSSSSSGTSPCSFLKISSSPICFSLDQDTLEFLIEFSRRFSSLDYYSVSRQQGENVNEGSIDGSDDNDSDEGIVIEEKGKVVLFKKYSLTDPSSSPHQFLLNAFHTSSIELDVNYRAKRVCLSGIRRGDAIELINVLPVLEGLQFRLGELHLADIESLDGLISRATAQWKRELDAVQWIRSISSVTPIKSFTKLLVSGFTNLIYKPLSQAGQGRVKVSKGLLRGLRSFLSTFFAESLSIAELCVIGTKSALSFVDAALETKSKEEQFPVGLRCFDDTGEDDWLTVEKGSSERLRYIPTSVLEGLDVGTRSLVRNVKKGLAEVSSTAASVGSSNRHLQGESYTAIGSGSELVLVVTKGIPRLILRPVMGAVDFAEIAVCNARATLQPHRKKHLQKMYKAPYIRGLTSSANNYSSSSSFPPQSKSSAGR